MGNDKVFVVGVYEALGLCGEGEAPRHFSPRADANSRGSRPNRATLRLLAEGYRVTTV
jgi:hypothetical protein